jgi:hypothetical protein
MVSSCLGPAPNPTQNERGYYVEILSRVSATTTIFQKRSTVYYCMRKCRSRAFYLATATGGGRPVPRAEK